MCGAAARGAAGLVVFPFTVIKARLEVGTDALTTFNPILLPSEFSLHDDDYDDCDSTHLFDAGSPR